jgi:hypothetical protein
MLLVVLGSRCTQTLSTTETRSTLELRDGRVIDSEEVCGVVMAAKALEKLGIPFLLFNQRHLPAAECDFEISSSGVRGGIQCDGQRVALREIESVYTRMTDHRLLPEFQVASQEEQARCDHVTARSLAGSRSCRDAS